jgi:hypothetical protein
MIKPPRASIAVNIPPQSHAVIDVQTRFVAEVADKVLLRAQPCVVRLHNIEMTKRVPMRNGCTPDSLAAALTG